MQQYEALKAQVPDCLLLFRMGDFYELFGEDAIIASQLLGIVLTARAKQPTPMAGVPHHSIQSYIQKLLDCGKKVAIGEQMEDAQTVKPGKIVKREIVRILTPGIQFETQTTEAFYLAVIIENKGKLTLSCLDVSTGETAVSPSMPANLLAPKIQMSPIRHLLILSQLSEEIRTILPSQILIECLSKNYLTHEKAYHLLQDQYHIQVLEPFFPSPDAILGLGIAVYYTLQTQYQERLDYLQLPEMLQKSKSLVLGPNTSEHLELESLFQCIDQTKTAPGKRKLKRWMLSPLQDPQEIQKRQKAIQEIAQNKDVRNKISTHLKSIYDIERICGRIHTRLAQPKDTLALGQSLCMLSQFHLKNFKSPQLHSMHQKLLPLIQILSPLGEKIMRIQKHDPPALWREGGIFKKEADPKLSHLIKLTEERQQCLLELENRERKKTKITSLKVRYHRVFGYYIEVTQAHLKNVPQNYQRKQTMVGAERFFTPELKKFEEELLSASFKQKNLEIELFQKLLLEIQTYTSQLMEIAHLLSELDTLCALSYLVDQHDWTFPHIDDSLELEMIQGKHPVLASSLKEYFVPNTIHLSPQSCLLMITGPNMGGKSTVMRQTALILLLGQMGAPVPAQRAHWGSISSLYTRIGAQDAITKGQSTFMVEMSELAHLLHYADRRSFILLDEIGRGTSTYDGISVAWATLEWISQTIQARTLFSTHYHELTHLVSQLSGLSNAHMVVENTSQNQLQFFYQLQPGPANESFGIHVAKMAGLPKSVIQRAWAILNQLETQSLFSQLQHQNHPISSIQKEKKEPHPILQKLQKIDLNTCTPLEALNYLADFQNSIKNQE